MPLGGASSRLVHPRLHELLQGSAVGDRGMPDLCTISRVGSGAGTTDPNTGVWTPPASITVHGPLGPCRAQATNQAEQTVVVGDQLVTLHAYMVALPASAAEVLVDDVVHIDTSDDPHLQDRDLIVRSVHHDTFLPRRLLLCDDHPAEEGSA